MKVNILVVDDEKLVCDWIKQVLETSSLDVDIETAENGQVAYNKALMLNPGIIITDIRMPIVDGLELCSLLKDKLPKTKFIIESGYSDFEYARKALKLGVKDYLLKPLDDKDVVDMVQGLLNEVSQEWNRENEPDTGIEDVKVSFIQGIVKGYIVDEDYIGRHCYNLKIPYSKQGMGVAVFGFEAWQENVGPLEAVVDKMTRLDQLEFDAIDIDQRITVIFTPKNSKFEDVDIVKQFESVVSGLKTGLGTDVHVGLSISEKEANLPRLLSEATGALRFRHITGRGNVVFFNSFFKGITISKELARKHLELEANIRILNFKKTDAILGQIFNSPEFALDDRQAAKQLLLKTTLYNLAVIMENMNSRMTAGLGKKTFSALNALLERETSIQKIKEGIREIYRQIYESALTGKPLKSKLIIERVKEYINQYYFEEISVYRMAQMYNKTPNYFCNLFKLETGQTFINYLNHVRIVKSKELLKSGNLTVYEVADQVGYKEYRYFLQSFKKASGLTPTDFRDKFHRNQ